MFRLGCAIVGAVWLTNAASAQEVSCYGAMANIRMTELFLSLVKGTAAHCAEKGLDSSCVALLKVTNEILHLVQNIEPDDINELKEWAKPLTHGTLGNYVRKWFDDAGAKGSLHGVRKGLSSILPHLGATSYEIDVLLGHELGSEESKVYVEEAERTAIATNLGEKLSKVKW